MLTVKVKKSKWYRGKGDRNSALLKDNGKMCCIGFLARQCGLSKSRILNKAVLEDIMVPDKLYKLINPFLNTIDRLYEVNDNREITDTERIKTLRECGKERGIEFVFVP